MFISHEAFVWLGRVLGPDHRRVGRKPSHLLVQHHLEPVAAAQQEQQHEYSPEHPEPGQQAPSLVAGQRVKDFLESVYIEKFHFMKSNNFLTIIYEYIQLAFSCLLILSFAAEGFDRADLCGFAGWGETCQGAGYDQ